MVWIIPIVGSSCEISCCGQENTALFFHLCPSVAGDIGGGGIWTKDTVPLPVFVREDQYSRFAVDSGFEMGFPLDPGRDGGEIFAGREISIE